MTLRSILLAGVLVLAPGCTRDLERFLGTYVSSGEVTVSFLGNDVTRPYAETVRVTEGTDSDILLVSEGGCALPAHVDGDLATVVPNTACTQKLSQPDGTVLEAALIVKSGTATRMGQALSLSYAGTANITYAGRPYSGAFFSTATLTRDVSATALAALPALQGH